jgi:hypothetical protein
MSDVTSLPVRQLFTLEGRVDGAAPAIVAGPNGVRAVVAVTGGTFKGERLEGTVAPNVGGDFALFRPDGSLRIDVRLVLNTNDGATIYMTYNGVAVPDANGVLELKTAPTFEVGDERYAWLNNVQAIGVGYSDRGSLHYDVYELLSDRAAPTPPS